MTWTEAHVCLSCLLSLAFLPVVSSTILKAKFDTNGVSGTLTFSQRSAGLITIISGSLTGLSSTATWEIRTLPVRLDVADRCGRLGQRYTALGGTLPVGNIPVANLNDLNTIYGRSVVVTNTQNPTMLSCATLEADDMITMTARFKNTIGGEVVFRQPSAQSTDPISIYVDLYHLKDISTATDTFRKWTIYDKEIQDSDSVESWCQNLGNVFNPTSATGTGCSPQSHQNCKAGDLSGKHSAVTVSTNKGSVVQMFLDTKLSIGAMYSAEGKTLVVETTGSVPVACAKIIKYSTRTAKVMISRNDIKGAMSFSQKSPFDWTEVSVNLTGLASMAGGYHIHNYPVPLKMRKGQEICGQEYVGGHFNPFNVDGTLPAPRAGTKDQYEVGDLSNKYGLLNGLPELIITQADSNLPLFGMNSVIGRSVVIHKQSGSRWICDTIESEASVLQAVATFKYPIIGYIFLRQPQVNGPLSETQVYMELDYGNSATPMATVDHNWHIHVNRINEAFGMNVSQRCSSVGGHYNPYSVDLGGNYGQQCNPNNQLRCELGDLSGKHGKLNVRTQLGGKTRMFFTDTDLPLSGPNSVLGRSIVIHNANSGAPRLACANLYNTPTRITKLENWSKSSYTGTTVFNSNTPGFLDGPTSVSINLMGLDGMASGYHVHKYPVPSTASCSATSVGGHYNPLSMVGTPADKTDDMYEIGDLSGKYNNLLNGKSSVMWTSVDTNLPVRGSHSVVGRSVVVHFNNGTRWKCANIVEDTTTSGGEMFTAKVAFKGEVVGNIILTQYQYPDGGFSDTGILIDLKYASNDTLITHGHKWHVHEKPMTGDCNSAGPHYNPFMVDLTNYTECSPYNQLRCEAGDLSSKTAVYDIGYGKRFYTDVNLNIVEDFGVVGRSIVIHQANNGGPRYVCGDILPETSYSERMNFQLSTVMVDKSSMMTTIAAALNSRPNNMALMQMSDGPGCVEVDVMFTGANAERMRADLHAMVMRNDPTLGVYAPSPSVCGAAKGYVNNIVVPTGVSLVLCIVIFKRSGPLFIKLPSCSNSILCSFPCFDAKLIKKQHSYFVIERLRDIYIFQ
ncbi:Superoxide dismutase [Cu-Zn], chloroplastic [Mizuhopecten yessoensis]|uniref:Superoxide dismutase [Cu-Zn], chloroplastic n=1 Tax=Mizuhopecten yessoensis TaxID=6573 RepID=A0A210PPC2_MIZYE|nr:Superoxide dismutase [Cu-Zn], chloroplastic [Mizuhopecten yessoensis]